MIVTSAQSKGFIVALIRIALMLLLVAVPSSIDAKENPVLGAAMMVVQDGGFLINAPDGAVLNLDRLDIPRGKSLVIRQTSPTAVIHLAISGPTSARISGSLQANGQVVLTSRAGIVFAERATVEVGGLEATSSSGEVINRGQITATAGRIVLRGEQLDQSGGLRADSIAGRIGEVILEAGCRLQLGKHSFIQANAGGGTGNGGNVVIKSAGDFSDAAGSRIEARGGRNGGNGGAVEISGLRLSRVSSRVDGTAAGGFFGGRMLLDPTDLTLNSSSLAPYAGMSQITFSATGSITIADGATLALATGAAGSLLKLEAGQNILFGNTTLISAGTGWSVSLAAGVNFSSPVHAPQNGVGGIYDPSILSLDGNITLNAGHEVQVQSGYVRTAKGGNVSVTTGDGDVDAGAYPGTTTFYNTYTATGDNQLDSRAGIATEKGGNVIVNAGGNIASLSACIGALGAGNVNLTAGSGINGIYYLRNGTGTVTAGGDVGSGAAGATLGLSSGGWNVSAPNGNVFLNEVYNFNGAFTLNYLFDYATNAYVALTASNSVQLLDGAPVNPVVGVVYPPVVTVNAGTGGVVLGNNVTLFPSAQGSLNLTTTNGGSLGSAAGGFNYLTVSDGASNNYTTFANGHAATPVHLGGPAAVNLNISGNLANVSLRSPSMANVSVGGSVTNLGLSAQNLSVSNVTVLTVGGDITFPSLALASIGGLSIGGPGSFQISARNLDLGASPGIRAVGTYNNNALSSISTNGASLGLNLAGDLRMPTSTIATWNGGNIDAAVSGQADVGSWISPGGTHPCGIYTIHGGHVGVRTGGDIIVNGSRLGTYDGGDVTLIATNGNVDAGFGGQPTAMVSTRQFNPVTSQWQNEIDQVLSSGVLALTRSGSSAIIGNIRVTASGDILAGTNGVEQVVFNGSSIANALLSLQAGGCVRTFGSPATVGANVVQITSAGNCTGPWLTAFFSPTNRTAAVGSSVDLNVITSGYPPLIYSWSRGGTNLSTTTDLIVTNLHRSDAGVYTVAVSNAWTNAVSQIQLKVYSPAKINPPVLQTNGQLLVTFENSDGVALTTQDVAGYIIQSSTNLANWVNLTNAIALGANGQLKFADRVPTNPPVRFYRTLEQ